jgi:RNA polymerase sigma-70 factor (ECF subfamily)
MTSAGAIADDLFRREGARLVAVLTAQFGTHRLQLAEDAVQEALVRALQTWPYRGLPENPAAWLAQTARNLALDTLRREQRWQEKQDGIAHAQERWHSTDTPAPDDGGTFADDTLRMLFVCCHPQLSPEARTALALRTLCGFSAAEIAAAFLTSEAAIAKRLVRARQRIRELELPFALPAPDELSARLDGVLSVLYLLFNEGHKASSGDRLVRGELCREAIRLAELLAARPATAPPRTHALLALMLLNAARLPARTDDAGNILLLHEQDRSRWDHGMIERGLRHLALAATGDALSGYHLEAGIAACHSTAPSASATDWPRILSLYDHLVRISPSPVTALNRAIALARVRGARTGLEALAAIRGLDDYYLLHAARGTFAREAGLHADASAHFHRSAALAPLAAEREHLLRCAEGAADGAATEARRR